ncbi:TolC family protein, partial [Calditrichota bacterium]
FYCYISWHYSFLDIPKITTMRDAKLFFTKVKFLNGELMKIKFLVQNVIITLIIYTFPIYAQQTDSVITLDRLVNTMLKENQALNSVSKSIEALKQKIPQMGTLPDPKLTIGVSNLPIDTYKFDQEPMTQKIIGITQSIPFLGKLGFREDIALKDYEIQNARLNNFELCLTKNMEHLYYQLYFNYKSLEIMNKNKNLLSDFVKIASTKYSTGKGIQQDVLKSQVELLKIDRKLIELNQKYESIESQINVLLNRLPQEKLGMPQELNIPSVRFNLDSLQNIAIINNPQLLAQKIKIDKSNLEYNLANREYWPDFGLTVNYGQRENHPDFISGLLSINIPLYAGSKQSKKVQEAALMHEAAKYSFNDAVNKMRNNVKVIADEIQKNKDLSDLYQNGILPQAQQALESAIAAYRTDKVDFITLLNNQLTLLNHEMEYYKILSDHNSNLSDLAFICGVRLQEIIQI